MVKYLNFHNSFFEDFIIFFCTVKYLNFHNSSFALRYVFCINGKANELKWGRSRHSYPARHQGLVPKDGP
jgi:hypothetical protein